MASKFKRIYWSATFLAAGAILLACIPDMGMSVHYNSYQPDFGAPPPPMVVSTWGDEGRSRPVPDQSGTVGDAWTDENEATIEAKRQRFAALVQEAEKDIAAGLFPEAGRAYRELVTLTDFVPYDLIIDLEGVRDRLELINEEPKSPQKTDLKAYFDARPITSAKIDVKTLRELASDPSSGIVRAHAAYALASVEYDAGRYTAAATLYEDAAAIGGPRKEPALMMAARSYLIPYNSDEEDPKNTTKPDPEVVEKARGLLKRLLFEFPNTRFRWSAEGWLVRCDLLEGQRSEALTSYLRRLEKAANAKQHIEALSSVKIVLESLTESDAKLVGEIIKKEPELLQPYLEYRIYHSEATGSQLRELATFAQTVLDQSPKADVSADIRARLAELAYLSGNYGEALNHANLSLESKENDRRDLATYVRGSALAKLSKPAESIATFEKFVVEFPDSYLLPSARENLAIGYEHSNELGKALDQYQLLGYDYDTDFMVDIRMSTAQLALFVESHPNDPKKNLWRYSLGIRYMRDGNYEEAEKIFTSIPNAERAKMSHKGTADFAFWSDEPHRSQIDVAYDPLDVTRNLRKLEAGIKAAKSASERSKATYLLASYYYERRNLLLYNAPLWEGSRATSYGFYWNPSIATKADNEAMAAHNYSHECLWRARKLCLQLVSQNPKSPLAAQALYRAACAADHLSEFNPWWRKRNGFQDLHKDASALMQRLVKEYPSSPLAKDARKYAKVFVGKGEESERSSLFSMPMEKP